jgi:hypothetical protein
MIDWSVMTGEEVVAALRSIPVVMHPWQGWGGERLVFASGRFFSRHSVVEGHLVQGGTKHACVQPLTPGPGWSWSLGLHEHGATFDTAEEAIADVDRVMRERGWKLMGDTLRAQSAKTGS